MIQYGNKWGFPNGPFRGGGGPFCWRPAEASSYMTLTPLPLATSLNLAIRLEPVSWHFLLKLSPGPERPPAPPLIRHCSQPRTLHSHKSPSLLGVLRISYYICICEGNECQDHSKLIKIYKKSVIYIQVHSDEDVKFYHLLPLQVCVKDKCARVKVQEGGGRLGRSVRRRRMYWSGLDVNTDHWCC